MNWNFVITVDVPYLLYKLFVESFNLLYEDAFPEQKNELKQKEFTKPCITIGI